MNRKIIAIGLALLSLSANVFAKTKGSVTVGSDVIKNDTSEEGKILFGGAFTSFNITAENEYLTAGGKIYYRLNSTDSFEELGQKLEVKKIVFKVRPFGNDLFEAAIGKLYSYYLPGNFFQLSEFYTGASRWGKTGVGFEFNKSGFSAGIGIPLTESYIKFTDGFGVNGALVYDFNNLNDKVPVKLGADIIFSTAKQKDDSYEKDISSTVSVLYTPSENGFVSKISVAAAFSYNAEPFVANTAFKNVSNYKTENLKKANFGSINASANIGAVQVTLEGEFGHSVKGSLIPLYAGTQAVIPVTKNISLKPKLFYYAALDSENQAASRQTFEFYPRGTVSAGNFVISAGYDFDFKQKTESDWDFEWRFPVSVEYKIGK